ncbi:MAG: LPS export ABC transporter permease LptF [Deltaproteobacteria bacterium]|nr:LPS export ABC transporter permease LptF [Deltaproteobacteria bacterium]
MPKTISSYIFKETAVTFALTVAIFAATSLLSKVLKLVDLMVSYGVGPFIILKFILFIMPSFLIYIIPMSFLISVLIVYNRLSSDNEITAMKASGLSIVRISMPVAFIACLAYIISSFFTLYAFPLGNLSSKKLLYDVAKTKASIGLKEMAFNDLFDGLILYANRIKAETGKMHGVFISDRRDEKSSYIIAANTGLLSSDPQGMKLILNLSNGTIHRAEENGLYKVITFNTYSLNLSSKENKTEDTAASKTNYELTVGQLQNRITDIKKAGHNPAQYIVDLHTRFALPASIFVFGLFGIPLGIQGVRTTRFTSFTVGMVIALFYYMLSTVMESLGKKDIINPILAVWVTDILFGIVGAVIFYKASKDSPVQLLSWLQEKKDAAAFHVKGMLMRPKNRH